MTDNERKAAMAELWERHHPCECGDYCGWCAPWACGASDQFILDWLHALRDNAI
jgi:hypothetical protein